MGSCTACVLVRWGSIFLSCVVLQWRDEDWAHYYKLLTGKIYPHDFEGFSHFLCTWWFTFVYIHLYVVATVVVNFESVLRDHGFHPRWKKWKEVLVLWDFSVKQKGWGRGGVVRVKYVISSFLLTAYWLPCVIPGNLEVGVHIADVSYFVLEETALDKVASERATSVYLVQKVRTAFPLSDDRAFHLPYIHFQGLFSEACDQNLAVIAGHVQKWVSWWKHRSWYNCSLPWSLWREAGVEQQLVTLWLWSVLVWAKPDPSKLAPLPCFWDLQIGRCGGFCLAFGPRVQLMPQRNGFVSE